MPSDKLSELLLQIRKFDWANVNFNWNGGCLILSLCIGCSNNSDDYEYGLDDSDFGYIIFSRDYLGGEWHENKWSVEINATTELCLKEMELICEIIKTLQDDKTPYDDTEDVTDGEDRISTVKKVSRRSCGW